MCLTPFFLKMVHVKKICWFFFPPTRNIQREETEADPARNFPVLGTMLAVLHWEKTSVVVYCMREAAVTTIHFVTPLLMDGTITKYTFSSNVLQFWKPCTLHFGGKYCDTIIDCIRAKMVERVVQQQEGWRFDLHSTQDTSPTSPPLSVMLVCECDCLLVVREVED